MEFLSSTVNQVSFYLQDYQLGEVFIPERARDS
jgi:hypothetical protein